MPTHSHCYAYAAQVRETGGLADTVFDVDHAGHKQPEQRNGFSFGGSDEGSLFSAMDRALRMYKERRGDWEGLSIRNMQVRMQPTHVPLARFTSALA